MTFEYGVARIRKATKKDAIQLSKKLRKADLMELEASSTATPEEILLHGVEHSKPAWAILLHGRVCAMFGVVPSGDNTGNVWLLGSDDIFKIRLTFLRHSKAWLNELFGGYTALGNVVDERNTEHVKWLRWLGFRFLSRRNIGRNGETFIEFCKLA